MNKIKEWWAAYLKKESIWGHISNVIFIIFVVAMVFPASRKVVGSALIKLTLFDHGKIESYENPTKLDNVDKGVLFYHEGEKIALGEFDGEVMVVNFWATWCPPCIAEMPNFQKVYDEYKDEVSFLFVTTDSPEKVEAFMKKSGYDLPIYHYQYFPKAFEHSSIPTTFIVNRKGEIVFDKVGAYKWNSGSVADFLDELIAE